MKPKIRFLEQSQIEKILEEAYKILTEIGIFIHNDNLLKLFQDIGCSVNKSNELVKFKAELIDKCLNTVPASFKLYDCNKKQTHHFYKNKIHFTPGSSSINILDTRTNTFRKPNTSDYIEYVKVVEQLPYFHAQSTAFIPADVPQLISDSYRLFLSLLYGEKPAVTGLFTIDSFEVMHNMLKIIRGTKQELTEFPLAVFTCCPVSPLKWSEVASHNLYDCAKNAIPIEIVPMPLAGFSAPVTLFDTLIQHTAEVLSGIVLTQIINPGTPVLFGGAAAIFDMKHQTTPMGAIETMMLACSYNEIGKYLNVPTQAYIALSDSKLLDAQAGFETGMGAVLAGLSDINEIAGPGMLDFINGFSLQKLVLDHEICGKIMRLKRGIEQPAEIPLMPLLQELLQEGHLLTSLHTLQNFKNEQFVPNKIINRGTLSDWENAGSKSLTEMANERIVDLTDQYKGNSLDEDKENELISLMQSEAKKIGMEKLPGN